MESTAIAIRVHGVSVGELVPIHPSHAKHLAAWREANRDWFLTTFEINVDRTRHWIESVIARDDRMLFGVRPSEAEIMGVVGLAGIDTEKGSAEIDHVLRGRPAPQGIMTKALESLIAWAARHGLKELRTRVFADNPAVGFYEKIGFVSRLPAEPMIEVEEVGGSRWVPTGLGPARRHLLTMFLPESSLNDIVSRQ